MPAFPAMASVQQMGGRNPIRIVQEIVLGIACVRLLLTATLLRLDDPDRPADHAQAGLDHAGPNEDAAAEDVPAEATDDGVVRVVGRETRAPIRRSGVLRAAEEIDVRTVLVAANTRFLMERIGLDRGDAVRAGDLIARLTVPHADIQAAEQARMMYAYKAALASAQREARTAGDAVAADLEIKGALSRYEGSRASLHMAERAMAGVEVRSPIDGVVVELPPVEAGSWDPVVVARIARIDPLVLEVGFPFGHQIPVPGARCDVIVGNVRRQATARGIAPHTDARGRAVLMLDVENADRALPAGLRVDVLIDAGTRHGRFIPSSAVQRDGDVCRVRVVASDGPEQRTVEIVSGVLDDPEVEVSGLRPGELVVRDVMENRGGLAW